MSKPQARNSPLLSAPLSNSGNSDAMQFLTLSIFILLLAFFVILNAHSQIDGNKVQPVLASLEKQFAQDMLGDAGKPAPSESDQPQGQGSASDYVSAIFTAASISFKIHKTDGGDDFAITLSKEDFQQALSQTIDGLVVQGQAQPGKQYDRYVALFTQLSAMLQTTNDGWKYHMTLFSYADDPADLHSAEVEDITGYMSDLNTIGFQADTIVFGLRPDIKDKVILSFTPQKSGF